MTIPRIAHYTLPTRGELPASKVSWQPDPARAVLLVHDAQAYFLDYFDGAESPLDGLLRHAGQLLAACRRAGVPVVYTAQPGDGSVEDRGLLQDMWGPGILARPERAHIVEPLAPVESDRVLVKHRYSAFHRTDLLSILRESGRDQLWICGVYAHIGCLVTANEAFAHDVKPFLVADALADFSRAHHDMALEFVAQRCGVVLDTASLCAHLTAPTEGEAIDALLRAELRDLGVDVDAMDEGDELQDHGLDSVRLLELSERLQDREVPVSFMDMMEHTSLGALRGHLQEVAAAAAQ